MTTFIRGNVAKAIFGQTVDEANAEGTCIRCKLWVDLDSFSPTDRREYRISGICPTCWVDLFPEDDPKEGMVQ